MIRHVSVWQDHLNFSNKECIYVNNKQKSERVVKVNTKKGEKGRRNWSGGTSE